MKVISEVLWDCIVLILSLCEIALYCTNYLVELDYTDCIVGLHCVD